MQCIWVGYDERYVLAIDDNVRGWWVRWPRGLDIDHIVFFVVDF